MQLNWTYVADIYLSKAIYNEYIQTTAPSAFTDSSLIPVTVQIRWTNGIVAYWVGKQGTMKLKPEYIEIIYIKISYLLLFIPTET